MNAINFEKVSDQYHLRKLTIIFKRGTASYCEYGKELKAMISGISRDERLYVMTEGKRFSRFSIHDIEGFKED